MKGGFVVYIALLFQLTDTSVGFLECLQNSDCVVETAECINNICECPFGQVFNSEGTACLPIAVGMAARCEDDKQCAWLLGKHRCNEGKCDCHEGWRYHEGRCIKAVGLHETCNVDHDCFNNYDILAMVCKKGLCECNEGYYLRGDYDCRPESAEGDYCSLDSDCKTKDNACVGSFCVNVKKNLKLTPDLYHTEDLSTIKQSNTDYQIDCQSNEDCTKPNTLCYPLTKKCICKRGYFFTENGDCVAELGVDIGCKKDKDCKIAPGRCIDGKCYCRKTYFSGKANNACQKPMTHDNLFCNTNERCYVFGTEVTCDEVTNKCRCKVTAVLDENFVCRTVEGPSIGGCDSNEECAHIINSICVDARCECPDNYRRENNVCLPNIGAECDDDKKSCRIENTICGADNKCTCTENHIPNGVTGCLKVSKGLDDECEIDLQCSEAIKNSKCVQKTCKCVDGYIPLNETCYAQKFMGDACTSAADCHVMLQSNVLCRNSICQCSADMQPTEDGLGCASSASSLFFQTSAVVLITICWLSIQFSTT